MVAAPLSKSAGKSDYGLRALEAEPTDWALIASGSTLVAAGLLLLTGRRRAGLLAAVTGATLAMLDQRPAVLSWWMMLPGYLDEVQRVLDSVQDGVRQVAEKRERLRRAFARASNS